jgi:hypothetical protein
VTTWTGWGSSRGIHWSRRVPSDHRASPIGAADPPCLGGRCRVNEALAARSGHPGLYRGARGRAPDRPIDAIPTHRPRRPYVPRRPRRRSRLSRLRPRRPRARRLTLSRRHLHRVRVRRPRRPRRPRRLRRLRSFLRFWTCPESRLFPLHRCRRRRRPRRSPLRLCFHRRRRSSFPSRLCPSGHSPSRRPASLPMVGVSSVRGAEVQS